MTTKFLNFGEYDGKPSNDGSIGLEVFLSSANWHGGQIIRRAVGYVGSWMHPDRFVSDQDASSVKSLIYEHQEEIASRFERLRFEIGTLVTAGGPQKVKWILLTEKQAIFVITLMKNTKKVVEFKGALVTTFYEMREELAGKKEKALPDLADNAPRCSLLEFVSNHPVLQALPMKEKKTFAGMVREYVQFDGVKAKSQAVGDAGL